MLKRINYNWYDVNSLKMELKTNETGSKSRYRKDNKQQKVFIKKIYRLKDFIRCNEQI